MNRVEVSVDGPHGGQPLEQAGAPLRVAETAVVALHGRGSTAENALRLADDVYRHGVALVAPQARRNRWYPRSFLAPIEANEPDLSSALAAVDVAVDHAGDLQRTPVFLGCSDVDPYVPVERVHESRAVFERLGGDVTERIYEGAAHAVTDDEESFARDLLARLVDGGREASGTEE